MSGKGRVEVLLTGLLDLFSVGANVQLLNNRREETYGVTCVVTQNERAAGVAYRVGNGDRGAGSTHGGPRRPSLSWATARTKTAVLLQEPTDLPLARSQETNSRPLPLHLHPHLALLALFLLWSQTVAWKKSHFCTCLRYSLMVVSSALMLTLTVT